MNYNHNVLFTLFLQEQRRLERSIARELKKPVDDMVLNDGKVIVFSDVYLVSFTVLDWLLDSLFRNLCFHMEGRT